MKLKDLAWVLEQHKKQYISFFDYIDYETAKTIEREYSLSHFKPSNSQIKNIKKAIDLYTFGERKRNSNGNITRR